MILRKLAEAIREQNWFTVVVEILIVVIGIFIGLQASDWNQKQQEISQESLILERLQADFKKLTSDIEDSISFHEEVLTSLRVILKTINAGALDDDQEPTLLWGLAWGYVNNSPTGRSGTFVEISSSGSLRLLRDDNLRAALQEYDLNAISADGAWLEIRSIMNLYIKDFTRHFTYTEQVDTTENVIEAYDLEAMLADKDFINAVHEIRQTQIYFLRWHRRLLDYALEVSRQLEQSSLERKVN